MDYSMRHNDYAPYGIEQSNTGKSHLCKLEDGSIVPYDACSKTGIDVYGSSYTYIGKGVIWSIFGRPWDREIPHYFFVFRENKSQ